MLEAIKIKNEKREVYGIEGRLERYAVGAYKVARDCFRGIKKLKIIAPADYAIMLDWGCFDDNSEVEIVLPKNMTLKQVYRCFDTGFEYQRENWTLISHKDFNYESESYCGISVRDFKHEDARYYKITASEQRSASGGMQSQQRKNENKHLYSYNINSELRQCKARDPHQLEEDFTREL